MPLAGAVPRPAAARRGSRRSTRSASDRARRVWDSASEARLRDLVTLHGYRWRTIQAEFGVASVTDDMLRNKWLRLAGLCHRTAATRPETSTAFTPRASWSDEEDRRFTAAVRAADLHLFLPYAVRHPPSAWRNRAYRLCLQDDWRRCAKRDMPRLWRELYAAPSE